MWIVRLALNRPYTFVVLALLILLLSPAVIVRTPTDIFPNTTEAAEEALLLFQNRYAGGVDTYLQVVTSQTTALANERNDIDIMRRQFEANVLLIKALGGGWDVSKLPQS
jgi:hypothetical protein